MGSSKRKASFRIDDILQAQQQQGSASQRLSSSGTAPQTNFTANKPAATPESTADLVIGTSSPASSPATMNSNQSSRTQNPAENGTTAPPPSKLDPHHHHNSSTAAATTTVEPPYSSPNGSTDGVPMKPHPVYPSFPDMQKHASNFYLPLSLGMPQFSPAAYLEHYANALQKGESCRLQFFSSGGFKSNLIIVVPLIISSNSTPN